MLLKKICFSLLVCTVSFAKQQPNIIILVADDQRREQANWLPEGRDKSLSPNMDRLAGDGIILSELYSPSPVCVPSRFATLTGLYPSRATNQWMQDLYRMHGHTFVHQEPNVIPETPTIAKDLKKLGYVTGAVGKNHVIKAPGYEKVDARDSLEDPAIIARLHTNQAAVQAAYTEAGFDFAERFYHTNPRVIGPPEIQVHNLEWVNEAALKFIEENHESPFFLYYAVTVPHAPKNGFRSDPKASPVGILDVAPRGMPSRESISQRLNKAGFKDSVGDLLWLDDCVGSVLEQLKSCGIDDNTIILYFSDHGVESGKTTCYQGGMRTFGFVWGKPIAGGRFESGRCSLVDIGPTLYEIAGGVADSSRYDGISLKENWFARKPLEDRIIYGEMGHSRAVIAGKWKYIALRYSDYHKNLGLEERLAWLESANEYQRSNKWQTFEGNDPNGPFGHSGFIPDLWDHEKVAQQANPNFFAADQLYDLDRDPNEQTNLASDPKYASVLKQMQSALTQQLEGMPGPFAEFKPRTQPLLSMEERIKVGRKLMKTVFH